MVNDVLSEAGRNAEQYIAQLNALNATIEQPFSNVVRKLAQIGFNKEPAIRNLLNVAHTIESASGDSGLVERIKLNANSHRVSIMVPEKLTFGIEGHFSNAAHALRTFLPADKPEERDSAVSSLEKAANNKYLVSYIQKTIFQSMTPVKG